MTDTYQIPYIGKEGELKGVFEPWVLDPSILEDQIRLKAIGDKTKELAVLTEGSGIVMAAVFGKKYVTVPMKDLDLSHAPELFRQFIQIAGKKKPEGSLVVGIGDKGTWRTVRLIHRYKDRTKLSEGWTFAINIPLKSYESGPSIMVKYYERPTQPAESQDAEKEIRRLDYETTGASLRERLTLVEDIFTFVADEAFEVAARNKTKELCAEMTGESNTQTSAHEAKVEKAKEDSDPDSKVVGC